MSEPEVLWESNPQYIVEYAAYESFPPAPSWESYGFYETVEEAKEVAKEVSETHSKVRVVKYGKD